MNIMDGDFNARAFNMGFDDFPINQNPYEVDSREWREYERGFMVAEYYSDEGVNP